MSTATIFCFPVKRLENAQLVLEPFNVSHHRAAFLQGCEGHPELFQYLPFGPFATPANFDAFYVDRIEPHLTETLFAILVKSDASDERGTLGGIIGLLNASPGNASVEIGFIVILPAFQRTFVATNAVGMLLSYTLDSPAEGLGLRRCQWQTHALNEPSRVFGTRMGFTFEGVQRFQRAIPFHKVGNGFDVTSLPEATGQKLGQARDTALFAHYCDEWPEKKKEVLRLMEPRR